MASDLTVYLEDRPGTLAKLGEVLGAAGINIDGICGVAGQDRGEIHVLVADPGAAGSALTAAGIEVGESRDVVMVEFEDRPGELGSIARRVAGTDTNVELVYVSCDGRLVLATSDNAAAWEGLGIS